MHKFGENLKRSRLQGVLGDASGSRIDFIAWDANANLLCDKLVEGKTYEITSVKIAKCSPFFCTTEKNLQVQLNAHTTVTEVDAKDSVECPLNLTPLKQLKDHINKKVNIAGRIYAIGEIQKIKDQDVLTIKIKDNEADVDVSFWRNSARAFQGELDNTIYITSGMVSDYAGYLVVNGTYSEKTLDSSHPDMLYLNEVDQHTQTNIHLSPEKKKPQQKKIENLEQKSIKQEIKAKPERLDLNLYPKCPLASCGKSLFANSDGVSFKCDKCGKTYLASAVGVCLKVTVIEDEQTVDLTFFNNVAEKFLGLEARALENGPTCGQLLDVVKDKQYRFVIQGGKKEKEFTCLEFYEEPESDSELPPPPKLKRIETKSDVETKNVGKNVQVKKNVEENVQVKIPNPKPKHTKTGNTTKTTSKSQKGRVRQMKPSGNTRKKVTKTTPEQSKQPSTVCNIPVEQSNPILPVENKERDEIIDLNNNTGWSAGKEEDLSFLHNKCTATSSSEPLQEPLQEYTYYNYHQIHVPTYQITPVNTCNTDLAYVNPYSRSQNHIVGGWNMDSFAGSNQLHFPPSTSPTG